MEILLYVGLACMALIPLGVTAAATLYALYWYFEAKDYDD